MSCDNPNEDCKPVGSNPTDPCSPCFEPDKDNFFSTIASIQRQVCSILASIKSWGQTVAKLRNRIKTIEDTVNNLETGEDAISFCSNTAETETATMIPVCDGGVQGGFVALEDECETISSKGGAWKKIPKGLTYYPLDAEHSLVFGANAGLTDYDTYKEIGCKLYGVIRIQEQVFGPPNGGGGYVSANGVQVGSTHTDNNDADGGTDGFTTPFAVIPLTANSITITRAQVGAGPNTFVGFDSALIGYMA